MPNRQKVFVGLSGGVDSSVSAALLTQQGYEVTGVFIKVWSPTSEKLNLSGDVRFNLFDSCQAVDDRLDAMRVCATLAIPFRELNLEKEYKKEVVDYMVREYRAGNTPNPDVMCNRFVKFGAFYNWAMKHGADFVATGHYARINHDTNTLMTANDTNKDQSYFLWQIKKEQLAHILFPVGGMKKPEVRKLAKTLGLNTADKKDSQGLCFIGTIDMKEFLQHYIKPKKGKIVDAQGNTLGEHNGAVFYTIGERVGGSYVVAKDIKKNTLVVAEKSAEGMLARASTEVIITDCSWLAMPVAGNTYGARTRYREPLQPCIFYHPDGHPMSIKMSIKNARVRFETPHTVAPGQSLVIYDGDILIGGGIIEE